MRQFTKETYEAPLTTRRVVTMESSCMAASNEKVVHDYNTNADIEKQGGFDVNAGMIEFGEGQWNAPTK